MKPHVVCLFLISHKNAFKPFILKLISNGSFLIVEVVTFPVVCSDCQITDSGFLLYFQLDFNERKKIFEVYAPNRGCFSPSLGKVLS